MSAKTTLFYKHHLACGAKMMSFYDWLLPAYYSGGTVAEHLYTRESCGVFDVSHMAEIELKGSGALRYLDVLVPSDITSLVDGKGCYSCFLGHDGGIIDDVIIYRICEDHFLICANASRGERVYGWLKDFCQNPSTEYTALVKGDCEVFNVSDDYLQLAIQGPCSREALRRILDGEELTTAQSLPYSAIMALPSYALPDGSRMAFLARTGYTGELGYELYVPATQQIADQLWHGLLPRGVNKEPAGGVWCVGLSARNSLRLESCFLLYGSDMDESTHPYQVGLGWLVSKEKTNFIGSQSLRAYRDNLLVPQTVLQNKHVAFLMLSAGIPRQGMDIWNHHEGGFVIGQVSSGGYLPSLKSSGGMARLQVSAVKDHQIWICRRSGDKKRLAAKIIKKPFYSSKVRES
ncbi:MAG: glycine cleavage system aminomethyltransferase GcvT [Proteobacteria bacterium]|nr:glycine cleavage system aminomethyltransferase GcvT [Pseudomonadota bacterium]